MLGWTHFVESRWGWAVSLPKSVKRAVELVRKAVSLDDTQPLAHALLASIYLFQTKHDQAIAEGKKAIALGPNSAHAHALYAEILRFSGSFDEAITVSKKAMRLHPYYPEWYIISLAMSYYYLGRYEDAIAVTERCLQLSESRGGGSGVWGSHIILALNCVRLGRMEEARAHVEEVLQINPDYSFKWDRQWSFYKDPALLQRQFDDLRKVGMK